MANHDEDQRSMASLAEGWHRWRHRLRAVDGYRAVSGNPNDFLAGPIAVGSAVKSEALNQRDREKNLQPTPQGNEKKRHTMHMGAV